MAQSWLIVPSASMGSNDLPTSVYRVVGTTGTLLSSDNFFIFYIFAEMGFHHVAQAGLELLSSSNLPAKCWDYRDDPPCPAIINHLKTILHTHFPTVV